MIAQEAKFIKRQEKQAKQLEMLEAEIVQRLKDTHVQQKDAIHEIEKILKTGATTGEQSVAGAQFSLDANSLS